MPPNAMPPDRSSSSVESALSLVQAMRIGLASKTYDRRWPTRGGRLYKQCFLHSDAVAWMMEHGADHLELSQASSIITHDQKSSSIDDPKASEADAVDQLNHLVDAGYVSHVCGKHRFSVSKYRVLYFRFHDDVIDAADQTHRRWKETGTGGSERSLVLEERLEKLEMKVQRLTDEVEQCSELLDEAHGKILVLEETVGSLSFAFAAAIVIASGVLVYMAARDRFDGFTAMVIAGTSIAFVALIWGQSGLRVITEHFSMLTRLMRPTTDIEEIFRKDIEKQESSVSSVTALRQDFQSESVFMRMSNAMIKVPQEAHVSTRLAKQILIRMRESSDIPEASFWPHRPVLVCVNTPVSPYLEVPGIGKGACPVGIPFHFSSELFEGKCLLRFKGIQSDDPVGDEEYFLGRRRLFQAIVQGKFKKELPVSEVLTGHEFARPLKRLPPSWMVRAGTNLIRRLAPGTQFLLHEAQPRALAILAATSQVISADMPGNEPDITDNDIEEDTSIFGGMFGDGSVSVSQRKKHLSDPKRAAKYTFDTESVYTFDFYQSLLDCKTYSLDIGFTKFGLSKSLDGQPIQVLSKTVDGHYLWSFQIWHEQLVKVKNE